MAKSNLLKTQDVTFLELIGNGKKYRVPSFQRDYAWEEEQWEDLWSDILELLNAPGSFDYMGALVVEATSDREFQIIDGQQRIATLSVELSSTDLLKNYLFSRVPVRSDLEALQRRWRHMIGIVKHERFPDFLRYHLLCQSPQIRKHLFAAMDDNTHGFWMERTSAKPYVRDLQLFGVRQHMPLVFATWERMSADDFTRVLKLLCVLSVRYTVIGSLNTNELEPVYHRAAKALLDGVIRTPAEVFAQLRSVYVDDEKFVRDFSHKEMDTTGRRKKVVKYLLCELETDASGTRHDWENDPGTIEHILPENPSAQWDEAFNPDRQKDFIYRLGNLVLLEPSINRHCQNRSFEDKKPFYGQSRYVLANGLGQEDQVDWSPSTLALRQERLAKQAAHVWRADFD
jgi:hypothetical protein